MATKAETLANKSSWPAYSDALDDMKELMERAFTELERVRVEEPEVQAIRFARDEESGEVIYDDGNSPALVALADESGNAVMEPHPLLHREQHHGLHAYRYEEQDDGSVIAFYINDPSLEIKTKCFANMTEASAWSPRDERE